MTKIVVIPDMHLQSRLILPEVERVTRNKQVDMYLFLGDYFDQWGVSDNRELIEKEVKNIIDFSKNHPCKFLLGNHDIPYLTTELEHYSAKNPSIVMTIQKALTKVGVSLAYEDGDYLFSHAGLVNGQITELDTVTIDDSNFDIYLSYLNDIQHTVSKSSGGDSPIPSLVWARPEDSYMLHNSNYRYQVMGHTPMKRITTDTDDNGREMIYTDTFSLLREEVMLDHKFYIEYTPYGDGSLLYIDTKTNKTETLSTNWQREGIMKSRYNYFYEPEIANILFNHQKDKIIELFKRLLGSSGE